MDLALGDNVRWVNKNFNTERSDHVKGITDDMVAFGGHNVSWLLKDDVDVLEYHEKSKRINKFKLVWTRHKPDK